MSWKTRTEMLLGAGGSGRLAAASVAVLGLGGVGSYAAEALARAGVGSLTLIDGDTVAETNLNRQLVALRSTLGREKAKVMAERVLDINPDARVTALCMYYREETAEEIDLSRFDYVADAIDMVSSKLLLAERCHKLGVPMISAMGAGNRLDPAGFHVTDVFSTQGDPLARVIRRGLRARGVDRLDVVFSSEPPLAVPETGERTVGSVSFVPGAAGLVMAGHIIKKIAGVENGR